MLTDLETTVGWKPIEGISWRCNGGINPLILDYDQLAVIAGDDLKEAMRWVRIHLECFHIPHDPQANDVALFEVYSISRRRFGRSEEFIPASGIYTVAQFIAKHGGTDSRAKCDCLDDLLRCFDLCGSYNDFDAYTAKVGFRGFNKLHYLNANNPNNGRDAFAYDFAWEGSHAVYISVSPYYRQAEHPLLVLDASCRHFREWTRADFEGCCERLARQVRADESDATEDGWRLWWD